MRKALFVASVLLLVASSLPACAQPAAAPGAAIDKVLIGGPISISGQLAKEGEQCVWGVQTAVKWVNEANGGVKVGAKKVPLEYKYYDDESKKELVTSLIERAITVDKVSAVMSPYSSGLVLAGAPIAEKYGTLYLNQGGASDRIHEQGFKYAVQAYVPGRRYHLGALEMFKKIDPNAKRLALSYEEDEFAMMAREGTMKRAAELGYEIVFNRNYPSKVTDLTPILSDLKASKPDIILGGGHFADTQLFAKQMSDLGIDVKAISLAVGPTLPAYYQALGPLAEGIMGPAHWENGVKFSPDAAKAAKTDWFGPTQEEYAKLFSGFSKGVEPDYHAAASSAIVLAFVKAVETAGTADSDAVRAALTKLKFVSFYGDWAVDEKGLQVGHASVDVQWQNGKKVIIWPESAATAKVAYPKPTYADIKAGKKATPKS
ncbi:MAG: amino acid ABC transporter substrate-binding protein [Chloroflexi bacterium]|nr:amino acid ABC transporter substrate-binding protein [Chloroflexota bacterium]